MTRPIHEIATEIRKDWKKVNYAALPYLIGMGRLCTIHNNYGMDSGKSVVLYFLANASTWRGETARRIKNELKSLIKEN